MAMKTANTVDALQLGELARFPDEHPAFAPLFSDDAILCDFQLLPSGLDPGQYFISISDSTDGDANFESSNCSVVNVAQ